MNYRDLESFRLVSKEYEKLSRYNFEKIASLQINEHKTNNITDLVNNIEHQSIDNILSQFLSNFTFKVRNIKWISQCNSMDVGMFLLNICKYFESVTLIVNKINNSKIEIPIGLISSLKSIKIFYNDLENIKFEKCGLHKVMQSVCHDLEEFHLTAHHDSIAYQDALNILSNFNWNLKDISINRSYVSLSHFQFMAETQRSLKSLCLCDVQISEAPEKFLNLIFKNLKKLENLEIGFLYNAAKQPITTNLRSKFKIRNLEKLQRLSFWYSDTYIDSEIIFNELTNMKHLREIRMNFLEKEVCICKYVIYFKI